MFGRKKDTTESIHTTAQPEVIAATPGNTSRRNLLLGGAAGLFLAACSTDKPTSATSNPDNRTSATPKTETSGSAAPIDKLKVAELGIATPEKLATIDDYKAIVEEFTLFDKYVHDAPNPVLALVETDAYLGNALSFAGTTPEEIASFGRDSAGYLAYVKRFNAPALEAMTGAKQVATGAENRHNFVATSAFAVQSFSKNERYAIDAHVDPASVRVLDGSYESGNLTVEFSVIVKDNLEGTQEHLNNPDGVSLNGTDLYHATFTKVGDKWVTKSTGRYQPNTDTK